MHIYAGENVRKILRLMQDFCIIGKEIGQKQKESDVVDKWKLCVRDEEEKKRILQFCHTEPTAWYVFVSSNVLKY